ncbi:glycoside hydrolase family 5 protein [Algoriphagus litoralis]|uniref:glycoside hydrolase family 5 protein n=1 Tax=Algoriphagus litoralis TaxID=2202829 RepID=UPI000DBA3AD0|nr:cellulase family glycosylhydrolase [Algoriphagus litoralis]
MRLTILLVMALTIQSLLFAQIPNNGINLTGMERTWDKPSFHSKAIISQLKELQRFGYTSVRLPLAVDYLLHTDQRFLRELRKVVRYTESQDLILILAYFDHQLAEDQLDLKVLKLQENWIAILKSLDGNLSNIYLELVNEPQLSPNTWHSVVPDLVESIRKVSPNIPLILGATNFNSLFELSRMKPWDLDRIIYTFHYYEPFLYTHQGTAWTGPQNSTKGIPYPFAAEAMPVLSPQARGTAGEINYRDYALTGNRIAMEDKIGQISQWAKQHQVVLWCTEFGVTVNSDPKSRQNYLLDLNQVLQNHGIPGFIWEWEGNFGVKELNLPLR